MKARTKGLASFEAGVNSPNLPWQVNITSLKHRSRFGEVPCFRQVESFHSEMQAFFWQFCFALPKSLGKVVQKSTRNSMELTFLRREQGRMY